LDEKGQDAIKTGFIKEAFSKATNQTKDTFSPVKFVSYLERMKAPKSVFFTPGKEQKELDGFTKLMSHVGAFARSRENPATGARIIQGSGLLGAGILPGSLIASLFAEGGSAAQKALFITAGASAVAGTGVFALKTLFTSKLGRNYLLAASKLDPKGPKMKKLVEGLDRYLGTKAVATAGVGKESGSDKRKRLAKARASTL